jgi:hypothetical protein
MQRSLATNVRRIRPMAPPDIEVCVAAASASLSGMFASLIVATTAELHPPNESFDLGDDTCRFG